MKAIWTEKQTVGFRKIMADSDSPFQRMTFAQHGTGYQIGPQLPTVNDSPATVHSHSSPAGSTAESRKGFAPHFFSRMRVIMLLGMDMVC